MSEKSIFRTESRGCVCAENTIVGCGLCCVDFSGAGCCWVLTDYDFAGWLAGRRGTLGG